MMMRAQTNIKTAVNRPSRERLGSLIPGQSLAGAVRGGYCTPTLRQPTAVQPRSLAERLTASILAPLIRAASPNLSILMPVTKSKGACSYIPSCYGSSEISLRKLGLRPSTPGLLRARRERPRHCRAAERD
jgi:hypothetical protein